MYVEYLAYLVHSTRKWTGGKEGQTGRVLLLLHLYQGTLQYIDFLGFNIPGIEML